MDTDCYIFNVLCCDVTWGGRAHFTGSQGILRVVPHHRHLSSKEAPYPLAPGDRQSAFCPCVVPIWTFCANGITQHVVFSVLFLAQCFM